MAIGNKVQFAYVSTGRSMPEYPDPDTIYFLEEDKEIRVGSMLIADSGIDMDELEAILDAYKVKNVRITGSGNNVSDISLDSETGVITVTKSDLPVLSKGTSPTPTSTTLGPGDTFDVITGISVNDHTLTDEHTKFTLPDFLNYEAGQGIVINGNQISLPQAFYDYLVQQTFVEPTIDSFSVTGLGSAAEIGTSVSVTGIVHKESGVENITGNLSLKHGSSVIKNDIVPASVSTSVSLATTETVTRSTAGSETFTLSGSTSIGGTVSKSVSKTFYVPKFSGANPSASLTDSDVLAFGRGQTIPTTVTFDNEYMYIYFVTDGTISSVKDADTGFGVPIESPVSLTVDINSISVVYNVYRSSERIMAGTYNFIIT